MGESIEYLKKLVKERLAAIPPDVSFSDFEGNQEAKF